MVVVADTITLFTFSAFIHDASVIKQRVYDHIYAACPSF